MMVTHRLHVAALVAVLVVTACGSSGGGAGPAGALGRVRLASNQVTYRDLGEAMLFAAVDDTLELAPGLYRGAVEVKGKRVRVVGDPAGGSELLVAEQGLRVTDGGSLTLEGVTLRTEGRLSDAPVIDAVDADLRLTNVRALDLTRPLARFQSANRVMYVAHSLVARGKAPSLVLAGGDLYVLGTVFADNVGPVFSRAPGAGRVHAGHGTFVGNLRLLDEGVEGSAAVDLLASVVENPGFPVDASANLVLASGEAATVFPRRAEGDYRPARLERQDADGLDFGAVPSDAGAERLAAAIPRWLELYNDFAAIRASGFVSDGGDGRALQEAIRDTFYRRVAAFLTGGRRGLLVRDVLLALPFAPADWHLRDRLDGALKGLSTGLPGRVLVAGDTQAVPGLAERLEAFFARAYPARDPNEERRYVLEVQQPLSSSTTREPLTRTFSYDNPEHAKASRSLSMLDNRVAQLTKKIAELKGRLAGLAQIRAASRQTERGLEERRGEEQLAQLQAELAQASAQQKGLKGRTGQQDAAITCTFKGERRITRDELVVRVGDQVFRPSRVHVELDVAPSPECRFTGFHGVWDRPQDDGWLATELAGDLLATTWLAPRLEALQAGLLRGELARTESDASDAFFVLLFQDLRVLVGAALPPRVEGPTANPEWLAVSLGADGYPVVTVPFVPAEPAPEHEAWRLVTPIGRSVATYVEERFGEPLFLFMNYLR